MRLEAQRRFLRIVPENEVEKAYIEEVLGMDTVGDSAVCRRVDISGTHQLAYIEIRKQED